MDYRRNWYNPPSQRRPETKTMGAFVSAFGRQWGGLHIVPLTTRDSATLETATVKWWNRKDHEFFVYIHYDTKIVWVWFNGNSRKCENVDQWMAAVYEATLLFDENQKRVHDANTVHRNDIRRR